ncbi:NUDIX domain-containing protein [Actinopolymorpha pittospori]|uniref:8-oxo-dGTP pyrophosphatase MutT (NUDIX family) n=1 Tax=Actinopolymorpha pittospori TaxID=648752 RepID=A0A927N099_9ACTN|nr:NUDIX domain-containing protein [Actinopolymorpha pittospori]MBE1608558.1 8-oxo-dGTP pyrophosphatase MutT (NUDIX family) [Actinopolymorpha pittospori]
MAISPYMASIRSKIGSDLLLTPAAGAAVFNEAGRLLLARHDHDGLWATIGGGMEPGESPAEAALRELREETGLEAEILGITGAYGGPDFEVTYPGGARLAYVVTMFACRFLGGTLNLEHEELREASWFTNDDALTLPSPPDMKAIIPDAFDWWAANRS